MNQTHPKSMIEGMDRAPKVLQFCSIISKLKEIHDEKQNNFLYRFIYFTKSCGKIPTANPFISTVKAGRKLVTPPCILITKGKISVTNAIVLVAISITDLP